MASVSSNDCHYDLGLLIAGVNNVYWLNPGPLQYQCYNQTHKCAQSAEPSAISGVLVAACCAHSIACPWYSKWRQRRPTCVRSSLLESAARRIGAHVHDCDSPERSRLFSAAHGTHLSLCVAAVWAQMAANSARHNSMTWKTARLSADKRLKNGTASSMKSIHQVSGATSTCSIC